MKPCPIRGCTRNVGPAAALCWDHFGLLPLEMKMKLELSYLDEGPRRSELAQLTSDAVQFIEGRQLHDCTPLTSNRVSCTEDT